MEYFIIRKAIAAREALMSEYEDVTLDPSMGELVKEMEFANVQYAIDRALDERDFEMVRGLVNYANEQTWHTNCST